MQEWETFRARNPKAKLVCIDLTPNNYSSVIESREDILNVGGFSDVVFEFINNFYRGELDAGHMVGTIKKIDLAAERAEYEDLRRKDS
jgi:60 kDa SS-A/Ro ribonucleoprotein